MPARKAATAVLPRNTNSPVLWANLLLGGGLLVSSLAVVLVSHQCRQLYADLQVLESSHWFLQEDYGRLLLEQSVWGSHHRVEQVATGELDMHVPTLEQLRLVTP